LNLYDKNQYNKNNSVGSPTLTPHIDSFYKNSFNKNKNRNYVNNISEIDDNTLLEHYNFNGNQIKA
jgi:hypothetical protein